MSDPQYSSLKIFYKSNRELSGSVDCEVKVSASRLRGHGFEPLHRVTTIIPHTYDTSTGWFQETDSRVIHIMFQELVSQSS